MIKKSLGVRPPADFARWDLEELVGVASRAARAAGEIVQARFRSGAVVNEKSPGDFVTDVDHAAEAAAFAVLAAATPTIALVGEESGGDRGDTCWLVDPIDGTTNFIRGYPSVACSVGLLLDGEPAVGVVDVPLAGLQYRAVRGGGAWLGDKRLQVAHRAPSDAVVSFGLPTKHRHRMADCLAVLEGVVNTVQDVRRPSPTSLDLALVAEGVFDGYFEAGLGPWDLVAGVLLVEEAGGLASGWDGDRLSWLPSGDIVAGSPAVHAHLLDLIG